MDRFVVMVDAGYLLRQSIEIISTRASRVRAHLELLDPSGLVSLLLDKSRAALNIGARELLRVYWYDGVMATGLTPQQKAIVEVDDVHFRAGTINSAGQQKGVDSLIVTDLIELAANQAICDAALVTGDSDLAVGIELAQKRGVRIAVLGVEDLSVGVSHNQSFDITSRADRVARIGMAELSALMRYAPPPMTAAAHSEAPAQITASIDEARIEQAVKSFVAAQASLAGAVDASTKRIDAQVDRVFIHHVFTELGQGALSVPEKSFARQILRTELGM
jgi:uncharacterized LabA/DUF88 family protein